MARSSNSEKSLKTDLEKRARNRSRVKAIRTAMRRVTEAGTADEKQEAFRTAQSLLDKAGRRRVLHPNTASRLKSRLSSKKADKA